MTREELKVADRRVFGYFKIAGTATLLSFFAAILLIIFDVPSLIQIGPVHVDIISVLFGWAAVFLVAVIKCCDEGSKIDKAKEKLGIKDK